MYVSVDGNSFPDILFTVKLGSLIYFDIFWDTLCVCHCDYDYIFCIRLLLYFCECLSIAHTSIFLSIIFTYHSLRISKESVLGEKTLVFFLDNLWTIFLFFVYLYIFDSLLCHVRFVWFLYHNFWSHRISSNFLKFSTFG